MPIGVHAYVGFVLAASHDAFDVVTLVLAVLGVVLGVSSLVWQAVTFVLTGARVTVKLLNAAVQDGGALTWPVGGSGGPVPPPGSALALGVEVTNSGRTDVDVVSWGLDFGEGIVLVPGEWWPNAKLPHRLQHGSQRTWFTQARDVQSVPNARRKEVSVSGFVRLGDGRTVRTREHLAVAPHE